MAVIFIVISERFLNHMAHRARSTPSTLKREDTIDNKDTIEFALPFYTVKFSVCICFQMNLNRAENKQIKKDTMKAVRNNTKRNFAVISKSIQNIIQLSRNDAFKSTSLNLLQIAKETEIEEKIVELLNKNYSPKKE